MHSVQQKTQSFQIFKVAAGVRNSLTDLVRGTVRASAQLSSALRFGSCRSSHSIVDGHDISDTPEAIRHASGNRRSNAERLVDADKIVVHEVKRERRDVVLNFSLENAFVRRVNRRIGHSHRKTGVLNGRRADSPPTEAA
jgi:hypothetical protein